MQKKFGKNIASLQNKALSLPRNVEHRLLIIEKSVQCTSILIRS